MGLVTTLVLAFGLMFQMPVVLSLLGRIGIVSASLLRKGRRYAVVGIAAFSALVTPNDLISMSVMAAPVYLLYEISIWMVWRDRKGARQSRTHARAARRRNSCSHARLQLAPSAPASAKQPPMHDISAIRDDPDRFRRRLGAAWPAARRRKKIVDVDAKLRAASTAKQEAEAAAQRRLESDRRRPKRKKNDAEAEKLIVQVAALKLRIEEAGASEAKWQKERDDLLASLPNLPALRNAGRRRTNTAISKCGAGTRPMAAHRPTSNLSADHVTLGEALGMMDFEARSAAIGRALRGAERAAGAHGAGAGGVHARSAHGRIRLHRSGAAAAGQRPRHVRHRTVAEVRRRSVHRRAHGEPRRIAVRSA